MDALTALLRGPRAEGAFVIRSDLAVPWSLRLEDRAPLTVVVLASGTAVLMVDGAEPQPLAAGDAAILRATVEYTVADDPATRPLARIGPGQVCTKPDGSALSDFRDLGVCAWGNVPDGTAPDAVLLTGSYEKSHQLGRRMLDGLPDCFVLPSDDAPPAVAAVVALLAAELDDEAPAQGVVLDRLVDLLAVSLVRCCLTTDKHRPAWFAAHDDPVLGGALRRLHHEPHRPWTIETLADEVGVSRATLARRFTRQVGEPVMAYLTRWRLDLAADLLTRTDLTVAAVAARVGYGSAFSLSAAFSRHHGLSPTAYRRRCASHDDAATTDVGDAADADAADAVAARPASTG